MTVQFYCYCFLHVKYIFLRLWDYATPGHRRNASEGVCWVGIDRDYDLSLRVSKRYLWALSVMHITISLASNVTNELVVGWCITERVKRLAGNEIELGIEIPRSNLGQVTYRWQREQLMLLCGLTDKDLRRICRNQYEHPDSAIGYWPENVSVMSTCLPNP